MTPKKKKSDDPILAAVRARAEAQEISRYKLAQIAGCHIDVIYRWFNGTRSPRIEDVEKLLSHFDLKVS